MTTTTSNDPSALEASPPSPLDGLSLPPILQPTNSTTSPPQLITQGAEALLYRTTYLLPSLSSALKHRPSKSYRHPTLDARLTRHRILAEARTLVKCRREGISVPAVYALDADAGWLSLEWIEGTVVREVLRDWYGRRRRGRKSGRGSGSGSMVEAAGNKEGDLEDGDEDEDEEVKDLLRRVGEAVGALHRVGIVHGDLTTSNMMLRPRGRGRGQGQDGGRELVNGGGGGGGGVEKDEEKDDDDDDNEGKSNGSLKGDIVLIDFGLASQSALDEDRAVDLYVLERAFGSTHPGAETSFWKVLDAYGQSYKGAKIVITKLEDVRMRGRKRSMVG